MSQDGYRNDGYEPRAPYAHPPAGAYKYMSSRDSSRSRGDRGDGRVPDQPQPAGSEAAPAGYEKADVAAAGLDPDLLAHIEHVIKQLNKPGIDSGTPVLATPPPPPPPRPMPHSPSSPTDTSSPMPARTAYTPPSPQRHGDHAAYGSPESTASMPHRYSPTSPKEREHPGHAFDDNRPPSRVSVSSQASNPRPKGPARLSTDQEETTLEKIWGPLFDEESRPTARLGQLLRGLAVHLIEDCEPANSIVVTPEKMANFYEKIKLANEMYPWAEIFDDRESSISRMYRELGCQHHLVQENLRERPNVPGLTPAGFERWTTLLIQAHPDDEYARLKKAVLEMPISNPDDKKERFPKDISRRLFPTHEDGHVRNRIQWAMIEHTRIDLPNPPSPEPPRTAYRDPGLARAYSEVSVGPDFAPASAIERERKPYGSIPNESAIDDSSLPTPTPFERERKPYRVQPGGGRIYEDGDTNRPLLIPAVTSKGRSNSNAERPRPAAPPPLRHPQADPGPGPEIHNHRSATSNLRRGAAQQRGHSPSYSAGSNDFRRSRDNFGPPLSTASSNVGAAGGPGAASAGPMGPGADPHAEDVRRSSLHEAQMRRAEFARRQAEDEAAAYGSPARARWEGVPGTDRDRERERERERAYFRDEEYYRAYGGRPEGGYR